MCKLEVKFSAKGGEEHLENAQISENYQSFSAINQLRTLNIQMTLHNELAYWLHRTHL